MKTQILPDLDYTQIENVNDDIALHVIMIENRCSFFNQHKKCKLTLSLIQRNVNFVKVSLPQLSGRLLLNKL